MDFLGAALGISTCIPTLIAACPNCAHLIITVRKRSYPTTVQGTRNIVTQPTRKVEYVTELPIHH